MSDQPQEPQVPAVQPLPGPVKNHVVDVARIAREWADLIQRTEDILVKGQALGVDLRGLDESLALDIQVAHITPQTWVKAVSALGELVGAAAYDEKGKRAAVGTRRADLLAIVP